MRLPTSKAPALTMGVPTAMLPVVGQAAQSQQHRAVQQGSEAVAQAADTASSRANSSSKDASSGR